MVEAFAYLNDATIRTVMAGAALLGVTSGVLGTFAVLRRQSLLGDTLSHAALPGIVLGFVVVGGRSLPALSLGALLTGAAAALLMLLLTRRTRLKTDAALGIALSLFFAAGVVGLTWVQGHAGASQAGLETFLFGQAAALLRADLPWMAGVTFFSLAVVALFWKEFEAVSFDPEFARAQGLPVPVLDAVLTVMVALAVVLGLQLVGVVLMAAMVVAPAVAARQWVRRLPAMVALAALFGALGGVGGALISAVGRGLATGPLIVLCLTALVALSLTLAPERGLIVGLARRFRARRTLRDRQLLEALRRLQEAHDDPSYAAEQGMVDAYFGAPTRARFRALHGRGLVRRVRHMPDERPHWEITARGRDHLRHAQEADDADVNGAADPNGADRRRAANGTRGAEEPVDAGRSGGDR